MSFTMIWFVLTVPSMLSSVALVDYPTRYSNDPGIEHGLYYPRHSANGWDDVRNVTATNLCILPTTAGECKVLILY